MIELAEAGKMRVPFTIFIIFFSFFLWTGSYDIIPDANGGELIAAGSLLGITHPTGYPMWSNLAHAFSRTIPVADQAARISILTAILGSLVLVFTYSLLSTLTGKKWAILPVITAIAVEPLFWKQCMSSELYGLHLMLVTSFCWSLSVARIHNSTKFLLLSAFIAGIALTNHLTAIFYLPLFLLSQKKSIFSRQNFKTSMTMLMFFLLAVSMYIYLPVRSLENPLLSWHQTSNFLSFLNHVTGAQFHASITSSSASLWIARIGSIPNHIQNPAQLVFLTAGCIGLILGINSLKTWKLRLTTLVWIAGITVFPLTYAIHDIDSYFLPLVWLLYTALTILIIKLNRNRDLHPIAALVAGLIILMLGFSSARAEISISQKPFLRLYGQLLMSAVPGSGPLYYQGDIEMNSISYLLGVEKYRDDLLCIDMNRNLNPLGVHRSKKEYALNAVSFRRIQEIDVFSPNGTAYIDRSANYNLEELKLVHRNILSQMLETDSRWNPYHGQMVTQILINLAANEFETGSWNQGLNDLMTGFRLSRSADTSRFITAILAARGFIQEAILLNTEIIQNYPDDASTWNNTAFYHYLLGNELAKAEQSSIEAIAINPLDSQFPVTLYRILLARGKFLEAASVETTYPGTIDASLIKQRKMLEQLALSNPIEITTLTTKNQIDLIQEKLSEEFMQQIRLLLIRKIQLGQFDSADVEQFADISIRLGYHHAALSILQNIAPDLQTPNYASILRNLNAKCFNLSRIRD